jgi:hypothetical protein
LKNQDFLLLFLIFVSGCTAIPKYELPETGDPARVIYKKDTVTRAKKESNYDAVMAKFRELNPDAKLVQEDKYNCYFQMTGYSPYIYKNKEHKFSYLLTFQGADTTCDLMINRIKILHYDLEHMYLDNKRRTTKYFNPVYEQIDVKIRSVLGELVKQLK